MPDASNVSPAYAGEPTQPCDGFPDCVTFDAHGLVPVVVQQEGTGEVLMVAWANREALGLTVKTRTSWFWSRSRKELCSRPRLPHGTQELLLPRGAPLVSKSASATLPAHSADALAVHLMGCSKRPKEKRWASEPQT